MTTFSLSFTGVPFTGPDRSSVVRARVFVVAHGRRSRGDRSTDSSAPRLVGCAAGCSPCGPHGVGGPDIDWQFLTQLHCRGGEQHSAACIHRRRSCCGGASGPGRSHHNLSAMTILLPEGSFLDPCALTCTAEIDATKVANMVKPRALSFIQVISC